MQRDEEHGKYEEQCAWCEEGEGFGKLADKLGEVGPAIQETVELLEPHFEDGKLFLGCALDGLRYY